MLSHLPLFCYTVIRSTSFTQFTTNVSVSLTSQDNFCCPLFFFPQKGFFSPLLKLASFLFPLQSLARKAGGIRKCKCFHILWIAINFCMVLFILSTQSFDISASPFHTHELIRLEAGRDMRKATQLKWENEDQNRLLCCHMVRYWTVPGAVTDNRLDNAARVTLLWPSPVTWLEPYDSWLTFK